ncbi:MAG: tetratricopeptide repeat protein [Phycisphaerae bacterium]|jgi:hypothetical protein
MRTAAAFRGIVAALAMTAMLAGCQASVVEIHHHAPADVPIPAAVSVGTVEVTGAESDFARGYLGEQLSQKLAHGQATGGSPVAVIGARATIETGQQEGQRQVRLLRPGKPARFETQTLPTLQRTAKVDCAFVLQCPGLARPVLLATSATYDSYEDPRVRAPDGLQRSDDPQAMYPPQQIVRELLDDCVKQLVAMTSPLESCETVRLRPTWAAADGLSLVRKTRLAQAAQVLEQQTQKHPKDAALWFDLAVVEELLGRYDQAETHYRQALDLEKPKDDETQARLKGVRALIIRQKMTAK